MPLEPISVVGLGYVGLPVAVAFGKQRLVIAYDINKRRLEEIHNGQDKTGECSTEDLKEADLFLTSNPKDLSQSSIHIIAAPTPIKKTHQPDLIPLLNATETVGRILKKGDLVIYESTVYPGCTEEECVPLLEKCSGLKYHSSLTSQNLAEYLQKSEEVSFTVGYSPERINPGDKKHSFTKIRKVVSGSTPQALDRVAELYSSVVSAGVYRAATIKVAEAAKVIENAQRDLNIAFINELALIFDRLGIDTQEVLEAAGTKWNFLPFKPGLVGGHCIGVDPYYLTHRAKRAGYNAKVILSGRKINDAMGIFIAKRTVQEMAKYGLGVVGSKVLVLGLTFKEDCSDLRNSRVPDIIDELRNYGCEVLVHDPLCEPEEAKNEYGLNLVGDIKSIEPVSTIILAVAHQTFKNWSLKQWQERLELGGIVIDAKGVAPNKELIELGFKVWRL